MCEFTRLNIKDNNNNPKTSPEEMTAGVVISYLQQGHHVLNFLVKSYCVEFACSGCVTPDIVRNSYMAIVSLKVCLFLVQRLVPPTSEPVQDNYSR